MAGGSTSIMNTWQPSYTITPAIASGLMEIEAARAMVEHLPLSPAAEAELRHQARVRSTHYSTRIEGNRLTLGEARQVIEGNKQEFHGRERDVGEVRNYWNALLRVEEWAAAKAPLTETLIKRLHALVDKGARARPTPYRDGQNVIRDSASGAMVYLPPEPADVPALMKSMLEWAGRAESEGVPAPIVAALVHYQFVTIHPYYDGNGRTARLLATFILQRGGFGLNGFFSLEEHHARDLGEYYRSLATHPHYSYYEGRAEVNLTPWLEYFIRTLARVFAAAKEEALNRADRGARVEPAAIRRLDRRARLLLAHFAHSDRITSTETARLLGLSQRMARVLLNRWVVDGYLEVRDPSRRSRSYSLSAIYRQFIGNAGGEL